FARTWDLFANSGDFKLTFARLLASAASPFELIMKHNARVAGPQTGVALTRRFRIMFGFLVEGLAFDRREAADLLLADYVRLGKSDRAAWLDSLPDPELAQATLSARQQRHRA